MPFLVVIGGDKHNIVHRIQPDGCCLGRGLKGTVQMDLGHDAWVSRRGDADGPRAHAVIFRHDRHGWSIRDLDSTNGTIVVDPPDNAVRLPCGAAKSLGGAGLFQVGMSILLLLDVDERPSERLIQDLSRDHEQTVRLSADVSHYGESRERSTETDGPAEAHSASLRALWRHVEDVLRSHGLADLAQ